MGIMRDTGNIRNGRSVLPAGQTLDGGVRCGQNCRYWPGILKAVERARRFVNVWVNGFDVKTSRLGRKKTGMQYDHRGVRVAHSIDE